MFTKTFKYNENPEKLINKTVYCKDGRIFIIISYSPDRGFSADEIIFNYDEDTDTETEETRAYPGYLTRHDLNLCEYSTL